ncbi:glycosyltransferase [Arthrobacter sp. KK5.5]|uniref:glycosyltransferase n=1 Tax=Arthrobacter sp. KK5.5 TaxID=3373084 RepID=UPI003EE6DF64
MSDGQKIALAAGLGLAPNTPTIGYVGRLNADKGLNVLAESSAILHRRGFDHQLLIVGEVDGGFSDPWAATDQLKKVSPVVTGFVGDTAPYYQLMDVFCLPTFREGFPNVVLEAGASGCPTVTTTATGAKDSVVDGVTGRLVAAGDAAGLADALMETLRGTGSLMGLRAREHVVARYDRQRIWNLTSAFYKRNN